MAKTKRSAKVRRPAKSRAQIEAEQVAEKAAAIGVPKEQIARGGFVIEDMPLRDGGRVITVKTLANRGGTPVARWKASRLLSPTQIAAIDHCERLWAMLPGCSLVADHTRVPGAGYGDGWAQQQALDDLRRIKNYIPAKYWSVFEAVCRFDEPAGIAGSALTTYRNDQPTTARIIVQFVADLISMREQLSFCTDSQTAASQIGTG